MAAAAAGRGLTVPRVGLEEWRRQVSDQLAKPGGDPFIASARVILVIGGDHTGYDFCWCQPTQVPHGDHFHGRHRETMD